MAESSESETAVADTGAGRRERRWVGAIRRARTFLRQRSNRRAGVGAGARGAICSIGRCRRVGVAVGDGQRGVGYAGAAAGSASECQAAVALICDFGLCSATGLAMNEYVVA